MNSKVWIKKALSTCLVVATVMTYSMVALANSEKIAGELTISGSNVNDAKSFVKVNGEAAQSGRSVFSSSTITTPENASAIVNLGKLGRIALAPNTTMALSFGETGISGDLTAGQVSVLDASNTVNIKTLNGTIAKLNAGDSAVATTGKSKADDDKDGKHGGWYIWAAILVGAGVAIIIAATTSNNDKQFGSTTTVISPTR